MPCTIKFFRKRKLEENTTLPKIKYFNGARRKWDLKNIDLIKK
jgi:hypothetical protein